MNMMKKEVIKSTDKYDICLMDDIENYIYTEAFNKDGVYIGSEEDAEDICDKLGISPIPAKDGIDICTIGFCEKEQKWYGWSHRAMFGFGIGSEVTEGDAGFKSSNIGEFIKNCLHFWEDEYHEYTRHTYDSFEGLDFVEIVWKYNNTVPNKKLRGTLGSTRVEIPKVWGRGSWKAETLEDAKQMAIDFAEGVS